jgi:hypothetical protein
MVPGHSTSRMPVIRGLGCADINARFKTGVFAGLICEPSVDGGRQNEKVLFSLNKNM